MRFVDRLFATKSLETLHKEMAEDEGRLRRVLGPIGLTSLGIGAIIGAGIFVMTGRVAGQDAGPAIMTSYVVAGLGCALAAFCYAEFASLAPVAGSAYTYAYATLGELVAWIIGWDLVLEYAMSCATVASAWTKYFNEFLTACFGKEWVVPARWSHVPQVDATAVMNLPAALVVACIAVILVIGIRESAAFNTLMVAIKLGVVLLVIAIGYRYVHTDYWTQIPQEARRQPQEFVIPDAATAYVREVERPAAGAGERIEALKKFALAEYKLGRLPVVRAAYEQSGVADPGVLAELAKLEAAYKADLPRTAADQAATAAVLAKADQGVDEYLTGKWGLLGLLGVNKALEPSDTKSNYFPYGLSGMMLGASLVFFAFIGFDSISTHAEEAIRPQRDVPFGILASLFICTILYIAVSGVITGMVPYPEIDDKAAVASAFRQIGDRQDSTFLKGIAGLIAAGGLAGMTSVILITFLSQARIFLAMARDGMLPKSIFAAVHPKFKTPHISTILVGFVIAALAGFLDTSFLEEMVNIGTLFAFVVVCAAVLLLRIRRPDAPRPFRCPLLFLVAPLGILVNVVMMLFLPVHSWERLAYWMAAGLVLYFAFGYWNSSLGKRLATTGEA
jgi:APA family basic amino acid/polyamine antiporter